MKMKILSVANQKSTGKSTVCMHLAHLGLESDLRVLLVSLDAQGSLDLVFPQTDGAAPGLFASHLFQNVPVSGDPEYISERLAIFRADESLFELDAAPDSYLRRLRDNLKQYENQFDLCIIDTPGRICMPLKASLVAADAVLCPVTMGLFELAALSVLWKFIQAVKQKGFNTELRILGILPNRINTRSKVELAALEGLRKRFGTAIMPEMLAERVAVQQTLTRQRPVWYATKGAGHQTAGIEWKNVCKAILTKLGVL
ncbi:ParA family protein [Massilia sp. CCM 9210]|uniref:ParA family protein n=1 Tax=Massilia scottii TaxID=3057166 RepID=UPI002796448F|nr:ParA family protein [Massilia sp. CCM 9210]MDQ1817812.1 ParA family protein [Massilia sp. CCM 9210]